MKEAYIYDALRSPRGKGKVDGSLHEISAVKLSAKILNTLKNRNSLDTTLVEDVIWGNVTQVGEQGGCLARSAVLLSSFDEKVAKGGAENALPSQRWCSAHGTIRIYDTGAIW